MDMKDPKRVVDKHRREGAQATVEFAMVISLLLLTMFAIVDFSRLFLAFSTLSHGVREGARYGLVHREDRTAQIQALVDQRMILVGGDATVAVDYPDGAVEDGPYCPHLCRIVVKATATMDVWTPVVPSVQIEAMSTMHFE